jgi:hypothetical protein
MSIGVLIVAEVGSVHDGSFGNAQRFDGLSRTRLVLAMNPRFGRWQPLRFFLKWRLANRL